MIAKFLAHGSTISCSLETKILSYDQKFIMEQIHEKWILYEHTLPGNNSLLYRNINLIFN